MEKRIQLDRPPLLVDLIIEKLQDAIIRGAIPPGTRLTEEKLSKELDTSRTPLREALFKLELMGFVRHRRSGGWDVPPFDVDKVLERFEDRVMIEVYGVLRSTVEARAAFVGSAREILARMQKAVEALDYETYREADLEFHRGFMALNTSQHLRRRYAEAINHINWIRKVTISPFIDMRISFEDHRRIVEALGEEDVHRVVARLIEHTDRQVQTIRERLAASKGLEHP